MDIDKGSIQFQSNLCRFLQSVTPVVQSQFLPKSEIRNLNKLWHPWEREKIEFFRLNDLWHCYDEWSAYGAGVPIVLSSGESLVQYYVPYLSAIQIFTSSSSVHSFREETESETRDSFSDSCSDESESEKLWRFDGCSSEDGGFEQDTLWHLNDRLGHLHFQYFERSKPYGRVPLMDKVTELAQKNRGLMSLRSVDLSPASWMAVAWYPIYHIPMGRTIKDLSTCFLTYHTLSSSFQGTHFASYISDTESSTLFTCPSDMDMEDHAQWMRKEGEGIHLPPFGLATYKMQGNVWMSGRDQHQVTSLFSVAASWLKQLRVQHHDFDYFSGIRHG